MKRLPPLGLILAIACAPRVTVNIQPGRYRFEWFRPETTNVEKTGEFQAGEGRGWTPRTIRDVKVHVGDESRVDAEGPAGRLDYVQLNSTPSAA